MRTIPENRLTEIIAGKEQELLQSIASLESEKHRRLIRYVKPRVVTYTPEEDEMHPVVPPGSVTLFLGQNGSSFLKDVVWAFSEPDKVEELRQRIAKDFRERKERSFEDVAKELINKTYADFRYESKTLAENLGLPNA